MSKFATMVLRTKPLAALAISSILLFENCGKGTEDNVPILTFANGPAYSCNIGNLCGNPVRSSIYVGTGLITYSGLFTFSNSDPSVATYDAGNIYPIKTGICTITAVQAQSAYNARASASFVLTVLPPIPELTWYQAQFLDLSQPIDIPVGTSILNTATSTIPNGGAITYTSIDGSVASVDNTGLVTGLKGGSTTITATQAMSARNVQSSISIGILVDPIPVITFANGNQYSCSISSTEPCRNAAISTVPNGGYIEYNINYQISTSGVAFIASDGTISPNSPGTVTINAYQHPLRGVNAGGSGSFVFTVVP